MILKIKSFIVFYNLISKLSNINHDDYDVDVDVEGEFDEYFKLTVYTEGGDQERIRNNDDEDEESEYKIKKRKKMMNIFILKKMILH